MTVRLSIARIEVSGEERGKLKVFSRKIVQFGRIFGAETQSVENGT